MQVRLSLGLLLTGLVLLPAPVSRAAPTDDDVKALLEQNRLLVEKIAAQQKQIDDLRLRLDRLADRTEAAASAPDVQETASPAGSWSQGRSKLRLSGEAGLAFFHTGRDGAYPNSEFRVDDAKLFLEAAVWDDVYLFAGLEITTREANDEYFHVGELYVDFEDIYSLGRHRLLNFRAGRMSLPFGEEYLARDVIDNPLISHSVADLWGIDEGAQLYGTLGRLRYNVAVFNGGHKTLHDLNSDKSYVARIGFAPIAHLNLSASAMRTGALDAVNEPYSEIWLANAFFRSIAPAATTRTFQADLAELDASWSWKTGHVKSSLGWIRFGDDNTSANTSRHLDYFSLEVLQKIVGQLSGAVRYSELNAPRGYPLAGQGNAGKYFYSPVAPLATRMTRFAVGLDYRFGTPLVWKIEYNREKTKLLSSAPRDDEDLFATEIGLRF